MANNIQKPSHCKTKSLVEFKENRKYSHPTLDFDISIPNKKHTNYVKSNIIPGITLRNLQEEDQRGKHLSLAKGPCQNLDKEMLKHFEKVLKNNENHSPFSKRKDLKENHIIKKKAWKPEKEVNPAHELETDQINIMKKLDSFKKELSRVKQERDELRRMLSKTVIVIEETEKDLNNVDKETQEKNKNLEHAFKDERERSTKLKDGLCAKDKELEAIMDSLKKLEKVYSHLEKEMASREKLLKLESSRNLENEIRMREIMQKLNERQIELEKSRGELELMCDDLQKIKAESNDLRKNMDYLQLLRNSTESKQQEELVALKERNDKYEITCIHSQKLYSSKILHNFLDALFERKLQFSMTCLRTYYKSQLLEKKRFKMLSQLFKSASGRVNRLYFNKWSRETFNCSRERTLCFALSKTYSRHIGLKKSFFKWREKFNLRQIYTFRKLEAFKSLEKMAKTLEKLTLKRRIRFWRDVSLFYSDSSNGEIARLKIVKKKMQRIFNMLKDFCLLRKRNRGIRKVTEAILNKKYSKPKQICSFNNYVSRLQSIYFFGFLWNHLELLGQKGLLQIKLFKKWQLANLKRRKKKSISLLLGKLSSLKLSIAVIQKLRMWRRLNASKILKSMLETTSQLKEGAIGLSIDESKSSKADTLRNVESVCLYAAMAFREVLRLGFQKWKDRTSKFRWLVTKMINIFEKLKTKKKCKALWKIKLNAQFQDLSSLKEHIRSQDSKILFIKQEKSMIEQTFDEKRVRARNASVAHLLNMMSRKVTSFKKQGLLALKISKYCKILLPKRLSEVFRRKLKFYKCVFLQQMKHLLQAFNLGTVKDKILNTKLSRMLTMKKKKCFYSFLWQVRGKNDRRSVVLQRLISKLCENRKSLCIKIWRIIKNALTLQSLESQVKRIESHRVESLKKNEHLESDKQRNITFLKKFKINVRNIQRGNILLKVDRLLKKRVVWGFLLILKFSQKKQSLRIKMKKILKRRLHHLRSPAFREWLLNCSRIRVEEALSICKSELNPRRPRENRPLSRADQDQERILEEMNNQSKKIEEERHFLKRKTKKIISSIQTQHRRKLKISFMANFMKTCLRLRRQKANILIKFRDVLHVSFIRNAFIKIHQAVCDLSKRSSKEWAVSKILSLNRFKTILPYFRKWRIFLRRIENQRCNIRRVQSHNVEKYLKEKLMKISLSQASQLINSKGLRKKQKAFRSLKSIWLDRKSKYPHIPHPVDLYNKALLKRVFLSVKRYTMKKSSLRKGLKLHETQKTLTMKSWIFHLWKRVPTERSGLIKLFNFACAKIKANGRTFLSQMKLHSDLSKLENQSSQRTGCLCLSSIFQKKIGYHISLGWNCLRRRDHVERLILGKLESILNSRRISELRLHFNNWVTSKTLHEYSEKLEEDSELNVEAFFARNKLRACSKFLIKNGVSEEKIREFRIEKETRRINILHRCITRFVLNSSEFRVLPKAFNTLLHYTNLRKRIKKAAGMVLTRLRRPNLMYSFRLWKEANQRYKSLMKNMSREELKLRLKEMRRNSLMLEKKTKVSHLKLDEQSSRNEVLVEKYFLSRRAGLRNIKEIFAKRILYGLQRIKETSYKRKKYEGFALNSKANEKILELNFHIKMLEQKLKEASELNQNLRCTALESMDVAKAIQNITKEKKDLKSILKDKSLTVKSLSETNTLLSSKLSTAQTEAKNLMHLLTETDFNRSNNIFKIK